MRFPDILKQEDRDKLMIGARMYEQNLQDRPYSKPELSMKTNAVTRRMKKIVELTNRQPMTKTQIENAVGYKYNSGRVVINKLLKTGHLRRQGYYYLATGLDAPLPIPYYGPKRVAREKREAAQTPRNNTGLITNEKIFASKIDDLAHEFAWEVASNGGEFTVKSFVAWIINKARN